MSMYEAQVEAVAAGVEGTEEILLDGIIHEDGTVEEGRLSSAERQDDSEESESRQDHRRSTASIKISRRSFTTKANSAFETCNHRCRQGVETPD